MDENNMNGFDNNQDNIREEISSNRADSVIEKKNDDAAPTQQKQEDYSLYNIRPNEKKSDEADGEKQQGYYQPPYQQQYYAYSANVNNMQQSASNAPKEKKRNPWKVIAIVLASIMFGCALAVGVILPVAQELGYILPQEQPAQNEEEEKENKFEDFFDVPDAEENEWANTQDEDTSKKHDYSNVDYPEELPDFDGKNITITDKYNPVPEIAKQVSPAVVEVMAYDSNKDGEISGSLGTGVIVSTDGYIVTNAHVVSGGEKIAVTLNNANEYEGVLMGVDSNLDIAVIKINAKGLTAVKIADSNKTIVGERVVAIGNPSGAGANLTGTVTVGYVSAVDREILFNDTYQKFIQTDVALNPGNSGGPLLNDRGEIIGIVTLKSLVSSVLEDGSTIDTEGIGFAIPINSAMESASKIILDGDVKRPGLGVKVYEVDEKYAEENNLHKGVVIREFIDGSLAQQAGLQIDDIICGIDGREITTLDELSAQLGNKYVGDTIKVTVWRDGKYLYFDIVLSDLNTLN